MPQIAQIAATYASQIFWMLVIFALIYFGIAKGMVPSVEATVDQRDSRIAGDLAAAATARAAADAIDEAYHARMDAARIDARTATDRAKLESVAAAALRVKAADADLAAKAEAAEARIQALTAQALAGIEHVAAEAARQIVARLSGVDIAPGDATRAVQAALAHA